jgi:hypothetical protein
MDLPAAEVAEMTPRWLAAVDKKYDRASPSESCGRSSDDKKKKKKKKKEERITIANQFSVIKLFFMLEDGINCACDSPPRPGRRPPT